MDASGTFCLVASPSQIHKKSFVEIQSLKLTQQPQMNKLQISFHIILNCDLGQHMMTAMVIMNTYFELTELNMAVSVSKVVIPIPT